jgi:phytoene synthase
MPESESNSYSAPEASHRYVLDMVRGADRERFLGALFAPEPQRSGLLSLLAFEHELARTRSVTREPMLARIRLEWWREAMAEAAGAGKPRAQPIVESLSETVRRHGLQREALVRLIDAREEEIEGPLDVMMAGHALADLELAVLGVDDAASRQAAHAIGAAWLMGEGPERDQLVGDARALRRKVDPRALPILLPAVSLDRPMGPLRRPLAYWWSARRGRY